MKFNYKTPEIKVEELTKVDVLCASGVNPDPVIPPSPDNSGINSNEWSGLSKFL